MKYQYRESEQASKLLYAKDLPGLPSDISLSFNNAYVRFYKSQELNGFFHCSFAIPAFTDDEGYVVEDAFFQITESEDDIDFSTYLIPFNDHNFDSLSKDVTCYFEEKVEMGKRMLLLVMKIKGTPFYGSVFIDDDMYVEIKS
ncbi:MAG: hypothetical protein PHO76_12210 [Methylotenera sp.]|nr:hypothetical protein [Methylotenera sp.]MDD4926995.1 hypothetical protein [Methylotenera sp.]